MEYAFWSADKVARAPMIVSFLLIGRPPELEIRETPVHVLLGKETKVSRLRRLDFKRRNGDKLRRNIMPKKAPVRKKLNRQEKRDLDIEIGFLEGLVKRDPGYVDALQILGDDYTKRGKFTLGLKIDQRLAG